MNKKFIHFLNGQEKEDDLVVRSEAAILEKMKAEFKNWEQLLVCAKDACMDLTSFFRDERFLEQWPVLPVKQSERFVVRKHTASQRPYYHQHDFFELIYVCRGKCTQNFLPPENPLILKEGKLCILKPDSVHALQKASENDIVIKMIVPKKYGEIFQPLSQSLKEVFAVFTANESIEYFIYKIFEESVTQNDFYENAMVNYLQLICFELSRSPRKIDEELMSGLNEYFDVSVKDADLKGFAQRLGYSQGYTGRMIKEKTGESFSDILGKYRLKQVCFQLENTDLSIDDIALEVGYKNASGLYKQFCAAFLMTPAKYRKLYR